MPPPENLNPWEIDPMSIKDEKEREAAAKQVHEWIDALHKEISSLLEKNGVKVY